MMLTQEEPDEEEEGAEGRQGEDAQGEEGEDAQGEEGEDDDEDSEGGYKSPKDSFLHEPRRRPMEDEVDKDFDPGEEVGIHALVACKFI
jgi:hypothetical protein